MAWEVRRTGPVETVRQQRGGFTGGRVVREEVAVVVGIGVTPIVEVVHATTCKHSVIEVLFQGVVGGSGRLAVGRRGGVGRGREERQGRAVHGRVVRRCGRSVGVGVAEGLRGGGLVDFPPPPVAAASSARQQQQRHQHPKVPICP